MSARPGTALRPALALLAYNLLLAALLPGVGWWLLWRVAARRKPIGDWRHRLGLIPRLPAGGRPRIWLHAVSAGEMGAARPVLAALRRRFPHAAIALSTHTDTGMALAARNCPEADVRFYLPFDCPATVALALWRTRPDLAVVVEKELWPNLLGIARLTGARVLVVNGRVSGRMVGRARWLPGFVRWLYRLADIVCVQSESDAARLRALGLGSAPEIRISGNTKADTLAVRDREAERRLIESLSVDESELWLVAGSTHAGEEEQVIEAFRALRREEPSARLLLAPRHLDRLPQVCAMVAQRGIHVLRRSEGRPAGSEAVVLLDTMGELRAAYGFAAAGFVGGTLVPVGGHNLLEPAAVGVAALFGSHTENCADTADLLLEAGVGFRVADAGQLAAEFLRIARDRALRSQIAARCRAIVAGQQGAADRCAEAAAALLGAGGEG